MLSSEEAQEQLHKVDHKELSLMQAVAYAELADHEAELECWKQCIRFAQVSLRLECDLIQYDD